MSSNGLAFAFGPGLGGGLSTFGMNVPILVNAGLCIAAGLLAAVYLPESPLWVSQQKVCAQAHRLSGPHSDLDDQPDMGIRSFSVHVWGVCMAEFLRGLSFSSIFSIFAMFAHQVYGLGSVSIGFAVCGGALCLISANIWLSPRLDMMLGHVGCASFGMALIAVGEIGLAYAPTLYLSLFGMCIVYMGQAVAGCTIATITSVLATDSNRGAVMSMQQMAQALGRVVGPVVLSSLFSVEPEWPYACASVASIVGWSF
jgi:MFS family permease